MADVPHLHRRGHSVRHRARLRAGPLESAAGHDRGVGILARRGDGHGADGERPRRRHEAGRRHAISSRRLRWTGGVDRRPGLHGRPALRRRLRSTGSRHSSPALFCKPWRWPSAGAASARRPEFPQAPCFCRCSSAPASRLATDYDHAAALASGRICYALVGWSIGLRFTREIVLYAAKHLPQMVASIFALIAMCGGLAYAFISAAGTDPLTAYLATSPGGADAVAIIAASSKVDMSFVMAMQIGRLLVALLVGPALARTIARWAGSEARPSGVQSSK